MERRHFCLAVGSVFLAGCQAPSTDIPIGSTPSPTSTPTPSPTPTQFEVQLEARLESDELNVNMDVVYVDVDDRQGELEYRAGAPTQEVMAREMATVAAVYATLIAAGHDVIVLNVTVLNIAGTAIASYRVESDWVRELLAGEITTEEYLSRVLETFESDRANTG